MLGLRTVKVFGTVTGLPVARVKLSGPKAVKVPARPTDGKDRESPAVSARRAFRGELTFVSSWYISRAYVKKEEREVEEHESLIITGSESSQWGRGLYSKAQFSRAPIAQ